jgi:hopanoid-associated phosphorylase
VLTQRHTLALLSERLILPKILGAYTQPLATALCTSGLAVEAKIARAAGFSVVVGAGDRDRTKLLVERAAARTDCLVSFGIAGALAPGLAAGTVVVSGEVVSERQSWKADAPHRERLSEFARAIGAVEGAVFGASSVMATQSDKRRVWAATGALAVDLESEIVARTATALGIPFVVLRTVADTARRNLPPASLIPLDRKGKPYLSKVFAALLRRPSQLPEMIGLAQETRIALSALIGPARALRGLVAAAEARHGFLHMA